jgi:hypothetical protein
MSINRDNYEAYLLDLLEGNLSAEDRQKVHDFLLLNPDCAQEINELEPWILDKSTIQLPAKEQLKKEFPDESFMLTETNFDMFSIARLEGDLTEKQESDHARMVEENVEKNREWDEWKKTKLRGETIIYANKDQLKHRKGISRRVIWMSVISSAAVTALLVTLLRMNTDSPDTNLASGESTSQPSFEEASVLPETDPTAYQEETTLLTRDAPEILAEEPVLLADEPGLFSIKKQPDRPIESSNMGQKETGTIADTAKQVKQEQIQPKSVRIASYVSSYSDQMEKGTYDLIQPLDIPVTSIHLSSLSLSQLAEVELQEFVEGYTKEKNLSLWTLANAGFKGINWITGSDMSLLAARDDEGDVSGIQFKSRRFSFATPIEQSE